MSQEINLKDAERKVFRSAFQDGLDMITGGLGTPLDGGRKGTGRSHLGDLAENLAQALSVRRGQTHQQRRDLVE